MDEKARQYQKAVRMSAIDNGLSRPDFVAGVIDTIGLETIDGLTYIDKSGIKWRWHRKTKKYKSAL